MQDCDDSPDDKIGDKPDGSPDDDIYGMPVSAIEQERYEKELLGELPPTSFTTFLWARIKEIAPDKFVHKNKINMDWSTLT